MAIDEGTGLHLVTKVSVYGAPSKMFAYVREELDTNPRRNRD